MQRPGSGVFLDNGSLPSAITKQLLEPVFCKLVEDVRRSMRMQGLSFAEEAAERACTLGAFSDAICNFIEAAVSGSVGDLTEANLLRYRSEDAEYCPTEAEIAGVIDLTGVLPALPSAWRSTVIIAPANDTLGRIT